MTKEKESFESRVREEIEKTGLPTEIKATDILRANGWSVYNEYPYLDVNENKVRTLDVVADKSFLKSNTANSADKKEIDFSCTLFIECKKSVKHSWVFFAETSPMPFIYFGIDRLAYDVEYGTFNLAVRLYSHSIKELKGKSLEKPTRF